MCYTCTFSLKIDAMCKLFIIKGYILQPKMLFFLFVPFFNIKMGKKEFNFFHSRLFRIRSMNCVSCVRKSKTTSYAFWCLVLGSVGLCRSHQPSPFRNGIFLS